MAGSSSRTSASTRIASSVAAIAAAAAIALHAQSILLAGVHGYQHALSPIARAVGIRCRFTPTCSRYAEVVIARDGAVRGGWKTLKRIARCNPFTPAGTRDDP